MKKIVLSFLLFASVSVAMAQRGVGFLTGGNLRTVFDMAKAQNKAVFLECYAPTCHVCEAFVPTFNNPQVGDFYNRQFISYKLDMTSREASAFLQKQKITIPSTPTLLFFDNKVSLMHIAIMSENLNTPAVVIDAASKALNPKTRTSSYKANFLAGNRSQNFLVEYGFMTRVMKDTLSNINAMNIYAKQEPQKNYTNNSNFLVLQKVIMDDENALFKYMIANLAAYNAKYDKKLVKQTAENIIMYSLYSSRGMRYSVAKINQVRANLAKLGVNKKSIDGRVIREESNAYFRENQPAKAIQVLESVVDASTNKETYRFLATYVKARTADKAALAKAAVWAAKGK
ncbi:MAG: DUF255 domain-containing protein [Flectobacillus sp.]|nr:DUF255 domain-containing protein [Flectobacillus sp.]